MKNDVTVIQIVFHPWANRSGFARRRRSTDRHTFTSWDDRYSELVEVSAVCLEVFRCILLNKR
jgi:hypothetical protein